MPEKIYRGLIFSDYVPKEDLRDEFDWANACTAHAGQMPSDEVRPLPENARIICRCDVAGCEETAAYFVFFREREVTETLLP